MRVYLYIYIYTYLYVFVYCIGRIIQGSGIGVPGLASLRLTSFLVLIRVTLGRGGGRGG